jgi:hypothetical protein
MRAIMIATNWKEIIPQTDAVLQGVAVWGGKVFAQYEQNATSQLKIFDLDGKKIKDVRFRLLARCLDRRGNGIATRFFMAFSVIYGSAYDLPLRPESGDRLRCGPRWMRLRSIPRLMK